MSTRPPHGLRTLYDLRPALIGPLALRQDTLLPAISTVRLPSAVLDQAVTYTALIPDLPDAGPGPYPVLYLLHPYEGDHADWLIKTRVERYVRDLPLLIVMPSLGHSLGCDTASGEGYERFFVDELMGHIETLYAVQHGPSHTAVAGAGGGGYGALRMAMTFPYWFGAGASLSGDVCAPQEEKILKLPGGSEIAERYRRIFGEPNDPRRKAYDLFRLAEAVPRAQAPALFLDCGQGDERLAHNRELHRRLTALRFRHDFAETPGEHTWDYWDSRLPDLLDFVERSLVF